MPLMDYSIVLLDDNENRELLVANSTKRRLERLRLVAVGQDEWLNGWQVHTDDARSRALGILAGRQCDQAAWVPANLRSGVAAATGITRNQHIAVAGRPCRPHSRTQAAVNQLVFKYPSPNSRADLCFRAVSPSSS